MTELLLEEVRDEIRRALARLDCGLPMALTYEEAARQLSCSLTTLRQMVRYGEVQVVKVRGRWKVPLAELNRICTPKTRKNAEPPLVIAAQRAREAKAMAARGRAALRALR